MWTRFSNSAWSDAFEKRDFVLALSVITPTTDFSAQRASNFSADLCRPVVDPISPRTATFPHLLRPFIVAAIPTTKSYRKRPLPCGDRFAGRLEKKAASAS